MKERYEVTVKFLIDFDSDCLDNDEEIDEEIDEQYIEWFLEELSENMYFEHDSCSTIESVVTELRKINR